MQIFFIVWNKQPQKSIPFLPFILPAAKALGLRAVLNLSPGKHDWEYWSKALSQAVSWLFQEENDLY